MYRLLRPAPLSMAGIPGPHLSTAKSGCPATTGKGVKACSLPPRRSKHPSLEDSAVMSTTDEFYWSPSGSDVSESSPRSDPGSLAERAATPEEATAAGRSCELHSPLDSALLLLRRRRAAAALQAPGCSVGAAWPGPGEALRPMPPTLETTLSSGRASPRGSDGGCEALSDVGG
ncbi:unnamed protein product, partial [Prorocentrum cordatum]